MDLPGPGVEPGFAALQVNSLPAELPGKPNVVSHGSFDLHFPDVLYTVSKTRPGADCGSYWPNLAPIAKLRLKLKKVGNTTRLLRYDLNQIPYNYTGEVRNGFKGLDLIDKSA